MYLFYDFVDEKVEIFENDRPWTAESVKTEKVEIKEDPDCGKTNIEFLENNGFECKQSFINNVSLIHL